MKQIFIVANWKANNILVKEWVERFEVQIANLDSLNNKKVIICPPFTLLSELRFLIHQRNLELQLGAQNISSFTPGPYTGEETAEMIKEFVQYVIIGHSERRAMGETEKGIDAKLKEAKKANIIPMLCVSKLEEIEAQHTNLQNDKRILVAFEPLQAIGSGNPDTPEHANDFAISVRKIVGDERNVLYGGSVKGDNVNLFTAQENINGVLVGGASLKADSFIEIIKNS